MTSTRRSASPRTRPPTTSRRRTASSPRSGIPTRTRATPRPRRSSRRSRPPTTRCRIPRSARRTTSSARPAACPRGGFDPSDFRDFAGQRGVDLVRPASDLFGRVRGGGPSGAARPAPERGTDLQTSVTLSFDDALTGVQLTIPVSKDVTCSDCHGTRAAPGHLADHLPGVQGPRRAVAQPGLLLAVRAVPALRRHRHRSSSAPARPARAGAASARTKRYTVRIPAGVKDGAKIRLPGRAARGSRAVQPGDLFVLVNVSPSSLFERRGDDFLVEVPVTFPEAALGSPDRGARRRAASASA